MNLEQEHDTMLQGIHATVVWLYRHRLAKDVPSTVLDAIEHLSDAVFVDLGIVREKNGSND